MEEPQANIAVLFVDIIDGARAVLSDNAAPRMRGCLSMFEQIVTACGGQVVNAAVSSAMYSFPDAETAVVAACEIQARIHQPQSAEVAQTSIRIGLHYGTAFVAGAVAQRMALCAAGGQIITTSETNAILSARSPAATTERMLPPRNNHDRVKVYEVTWQAGGSHTRMPPRLNTIIEQAGVARLRLTHAGRETNVITSITIGRRSSHGIELKNLKVSRDHAYIQRREEKFVLVDQSSHGTYVKLTSGETYKLRHQEMVLQGSGTISFGHEATDEIVSFLCEVHVAVPTPVTIPPRPQESSD